MTSSLLLVNWGPVVREGGGSSSRRWEEGGNLGLDLCLLGQEDLEFLLLLIVDTGVDPQVRHAGQLCLVLLDVEGLLLGVS